MRKINTGLRRCGDVGRRGRESRSSRSSADRDARQRAVGARDRPRADALSAYLGFRPQVDSTDADREVICNIFPGGLPQDPAYPTAVYSQESARFGRGAYAAGTLGTGEAGNSNTCGDKGKGTVCRLSGTAFASPTALDGREASTGSATTRTLLGLGYLVYPWGGYQPAI